MPNRPCWWYGNAPWWKRRTPCLFLVDFPFSWCFCNVRCKINPKSYTQLKKFSFKLILQSQLNANVQLIFLIWSLLWSESPALCPVHILLDSREIGCQAVQLLATFLELSVIKVWSDIDILWSEQDLWAEISNEFVSILLAQIRSCVPLRNFTLCPTDMIASRL